ncbi:molybdopterin-dependent oxidoreductase [Aldersonia kunmingensis]|uniref:molybdopterin-dependent oxidoreductase n=1 Tax=Aldersonia kunmingensis TaxID=408066 RepID=UPI00082FECB7|nr:molybdopterin-dependent oxidoreductase [Aldersonia kunmingensis]
MIGLRALSGTVSALVLLGVAELLALGFGEYSSPLRALGSAVVDHTPDGVRESVIDTFGTNDKLVLYVCMAVAAIVLAAVAGIVERITRPIGSVLFAAMSVFAAWASVSRADTGWAGAIPVLAGAVAGIATLRALVRRLEPAEPCPPTRGGTTSVERREFLNLAIGLGAAGVVAGVLGRWIGSRMRDVSGNRAEVVLPAAKDVGAAIPEGADLRVPGLASYITDNSEFYRIDTALVVPQVSTQEWSLRIHGMVDREITLYWDDLATRPTVERTVTLTCVSNPVGGDLVGNATWLGYRLAELLAEAGPSPDADMVLSRSFDGFTAGSPLEVLTDGRDAMLAVGMNGEPLPIPHGYPARLVVPGLYGYVSATKWVTELEVTRFDRAEAYWTQRGWSARGPIKTASRIDTPRGSAKLQPGSVIIAGVAWAQNRGISAVEVQVDDGDWRPAKLSEMYSKDTWRQWAYEWDATPGPHTLRARATDGTGEVQTADVVDVIPDGATGYPAVFVKVSD